MTSAERERDIADRMLQSDVSCAQMRTRLSLIAGMLARAFPQVAPRARQVGSGGAIGGTASPREGRTDERGL